MENALFDKYQRPSGNKCHVILALNPTGRAMMTRDMGLIRKILAHIQNRDDVELRLVEIPGVEEWIVARHVEMLLHHGFIEGEESGAYNAPFPNIAVKDLTMNGHDFAAALGNDSVWASIKKIPKAELAAISLKVINELGQGLLLKWAKAQVGLAD